jgi:hypothetical protein
VQALHLAKAIRKLEGVCSLQFRPVTELSLEEYYRFRDMPEYDIFIEAALTCGFVCTDYARFFPIEDAHSNPSEVISALPFAKLRHYIHTLQRAEKWNSEYSTALWTAVMCGALPLVARRLESDQSLYESEEECIDEEI